MCKSAVCTVRVLRSKLRKFFDLRDPSRHFGYNKLMDKSALSLVPQCLVPYEKLIAKLEFPVLLSARWHVIIEMIETEKISSVSDPSVETDDETSALTQ